MRPPLLTPYDGSSPLFRIGAKPLDPAEWVVVDERLPACLAEKTRLMAERPAEVFGAEPGTEAGQAEVLALLVEHLLRRFPESYRRAGGVIEIVPAGRSVRLDAADAPLAIAAALVAEDLVLMRRGESGWRLAAGSVCFPSSWRLAEKIGRPIHEVHAPVPGFGAGTRNAELIARMFDAMRVETPMLRWNWSLYGDDALHHPHDSPPRRFGAGAEADPVFLRVERQVLRKLPESGDIVFAIHISVDPLERLETEPDGARIVAALAEQLAGLTDEQLQYKGLTPERERLLSRLGSLAALPR